MFATLNIKTTKAIIMNIVIKYSKQGMFYAIPHTAPPSKNGDVDVSISKMASKYKKIKQYYKSVEHPQHIIE